jgi:hypothetical protein
VTNRSRMRDILQMLTLDDVARKLGVPVTDVRVLVDTDQLPHFRLGRNGEQIRIIQRDLVAFKSEIDVQRNSHT